MAQASMAANPALKEVYVQLKTRMEKAVEDFRREMAATRTGRASVHMLDSVSVDYYGSSIYRDHSSPNMSHGAVRTARNLALPLIMCSYASAARSSGKTSLIARTPVSRLKESVS